MITLAFDTATADTVVGLHVPGAPPRAAAHVPAAGERPGHATQLLGLARGLLDAAGLRWAEVERIGVGLGPGTFTGLRIGVASARALAQSGGQELVGVGSLETLARGAAVDDAVLACLDARRGEAWVAAWRGAVPLLGAPRAVAPEDLAALLTTGSGPWRAVGDGALRFRTELEAAGVHVADDDAAVHHLDGGTLVALAATATVVDRDTLEPHYVRAPDAVPTRLR